MIDLKNIGQKQADLLRDAYLNKKVAHSYLFVDPMQKKGINTAYWLACLLIAWEKISQTELVTIARES